MDEAGALYLPERLHAVRISVKKLRYALELSVDASRVSSTRPKAAGRTTDLALLKRGQTTLGRLHDLQVLIDYARRAQAALDPLDRGARRELDALVIVLEQQCRRLHARYVRERSSIAATCDGLSTTRSGRTLRRAG
jgi:CHAD domain-containing protein